MRSVARTRHLNEAENISRFWRTLNRCLGGRDLPRGKKPSASRSMHMLDIIMLAIGLGFFVLSLGYAYACERL